MLERVVKLEEQVAGLVVDVAVIKSNYATREDVYNLREEMHRLITAQTKWGVATLLAVMGLGLTIAKVIF